MDLLTDMAKTTFDDIDEAGVKDLCAAVVHQAALDYRRARKYFRKQDFDKRKESVRQREVQLRWMKEAYEDFGIPWPVNGQRCGTSPAIRRLMRRASDMHSELYRMDRLLKDAEKFFESEWFYAMGGSPEMYRQLKRECDHGFFRRLKEEI